MAQADFSRIGSNIGALNALNSLNTINRKLGMHQTRLSTGKRINSAEDDPAGMTIATKMLARSESLKVAMNNIGDAKNMMSVAESGLSKITDILVQMRSKAQQAANDTLGTAERQAIQSQLSSFAEQIDNIVNETKWNGVRLLDGTIDKKFQTGADEGEYTQWQLNQQHDPTTLRISEENAVADVTGVATVGGSITGASDVAAFSGLSKLATGRYNIEVLTAATAALGAVDIQGNPPTAFAGLTATAGALGAELASGTYTLEITGGGDLTNFDDVNYRVLASDGSVVGSAAAVDFSGAAVDLDLGGGTIGVSLDVNAALNVGDKITFEYVARNHAKYELQDGSGVALDVDVDGVAGGATGKFGYYDATAAGTVDTGRGFSFANAIIGSTSAGDSFSFDYKEAGDFVVDVSTAEKAASYMTTVDTAIDTVTKSLSDLGSLMARLSYKEEATAVAQVNVEASYNRIMNADMAYEQLESTKMGILQQTATAMLSQANQAPSSIMSLFR